MVEITFIEYRVPGMIPCSGEERKLTWMRQKKRIWLFMQMELEACRDEYN